MDERMFRDEYGAYVCDDGSYGIGRMIIFNAFDITNGQWEWLSHLSDAQRIGYVEALLRDEKDLSHWEPVYE